MEDIRLSEWLDSVAWPVCRVDDQMRPVTNRAWRELPGRVSEAALDALNQAVLSGCQGAVQCELQGGSLWVSRDATGWVGLWLPVPEWTAPEGVLQRQQFEQALQREFQRAQRYNEALCIAQIRLPAEALAEHVRDWIQGQLRATDRTWDVAPGVLRLLLPETTAAGGEVLLKRIARGLMTSVGPVVTVRWANRSSQQTHYSELLRALDYARDWQPEPQGKE